MLGYIKFCDAEEPRGDEILLIKGNDKSEINAAAKAAMDDIFITYLYEIEFLNCYSFEKFEAGFNEITDNSDYEKVDEYFPWLESFLKANGLQVYYFDGADDKELFDDVWHSVLKEENNG